MASVPGIQDGALWPQDTRLRPLGGEGSRLEPQRASGTNFGDMLREGLESVSALHDDAKRKTQGLVTGETKEIHEVLVAGGKADVAFHLMLEVRNRLVEAWREITRLQV